MRSDHLLLPMHRRRKAAPVYGSYSDPVRGLTTIHAAVASRSTLGREGQIVTRVEEPDNSPFLESKCYGERRLARDEVLSKEGGLEWALERRDDFGRHHQPSSTLLLRDVGA